MTASTSRISDFFNNKVVTISSRNGTNVCSISGIIDFKKQGIRIKLSNDPSSFSIGQTVIVSRTESSENEAITSQIMCNITEIGSDYLKLEYVSHEFNKQIFSRNFLEELVENIPSIQPSINEANKKISMETLYSNNKAELFISGNSKLWEFMTSYKLDKNNVLHLKLPTNPFIDRFLTFENQCVMSINNPIYGKIQYQGLLQYKNENYEFIPLRMQYGSKSKLETYEFPENEQNIFHEIISYSKRRIHFFIRLYRLSFLTLSLIPIILATSLVYWTYGSVNIMSFMLEMLTITCVQIASNLMNDYYDDKSNSDEYVMISSSFTSGTKFIQLGLIDSSSVLSSSLLLIMFGVIFGLYLISLTNSLNLIWFGVLGILISVFYSIPPIKLAYRKFGDIIFSLSLSYLLVLGTLYLQTQKLFDFNFILAGIIIGLEINLILFAGNISSHVGENAANKSSLVSDFGLRTSYYFLFGQKLVSSLLFLILIFQLKQIFLIASFLALPLIIKEFTRIRKDNFSDSPNSQLFQLLLVIFNLQFLSFCLILMIL